MGKIARGKIAIKKQASMPQNLFILVLVVIALISMFGVATGYQGEIQLKFGVDGISLLLNGHS